MSRQINEIVQRELNTRKYESFREKETVNEIRETATRENNNAKREYNNKREYKKERECKNTREINARENKNGINRGNKDNNGKINPVKRRKQSQEEETHEEFEENSSGKSQKKYPYTQEEIEEIISEINYMRYKIKEIIKSNKNEKIINKRIKSIIPSEEEIREEINNPHFKESIDLVVERCKEIIKFKNKSQILRELIELDSEENSNESQSKVNNKDSFQDTESCDFEQEIINTKEYFAELKSKIVAMLKFDKDRKDIINRLRYVIPTDSEIESLIEDPEFIERVNTAFNSCEEILEFREESRMLANLRNYIPKTDLYDADGKLIEKAYVRVKETNTLKRRLTTKKSEEQEEENSKKPKKSASYSKAKEEKIQERPAR